MNFCACPRRTPIMMPMRGCRSQAIRFEYKKSNSERQSELPASGNLGNHSTNKGRICSVTGDSAAFSGKFFALGARFEHIGKKKARKASQPATEQESKKNHQFTYPVCQKTLPSAIFKLFNYLRELKLALLWPSLYIGTAKPLAITRLSQIKAPPDQVNMEIV
jgi:hypothetical protein